MGAGLLSMLALRAAVCLLPPLRGAGQATHPVDARIWVADRDADALAGLDAGLIHLRDRPLRRPIQISRSGSSLWVLCAEGGWAAGDHALYRLGWEGGLLHRFPLGPGRAEIAPVRGGVLCLQRAGTSESCVLTLVEEGGSSRELLRFSAVRLRLGSDGKRRAAFALGENRLGLIDLPRAEVGPVRFEERGLDVGPEGFEPTRLADLAWARGDLFTLEEDGVLRRLDPKRGELWSDRSAECWGSDRSAPGLFVGSSAIWVHSRRRAWIERRHPEDGRRLGRGQSGLPHGVVDGGAADGKGGAIFAAGGALLRLDARGRVAPGQGGFRYVSDLAVLPEKPTPPR